MADSKPSLERVLVLDGETRAALAVVRSLGAAGYACIVASHKRSSLAGASTFARSSVYSPSPMLAPDTYAAWLLECVEELNPSFLLPVTDASLQVVAALKDSLPRTTRIPLADMATARRVSDKFLLLSDARELGIRTPTTILIPGKAERNATTYEQIANFPYPAVAKLNSSVSSLNSHLVKDSTYYLANAREAQDLFDGRAPLAALPALLQQRVEGVGVGVFALCRQGQSLATFCHRRLLEKPPSGGRSVLSESIPESEAPVADALHLLKHYHWDGVAMVEFKRTAAGECYLMEINPRFWGSLQLAVDCGRDFPRLLLEAAKTGWPPPADTALQLPTVVVGRRLRWELGCLDHLLARLRGGFRATVHGVLAHNLLEIRRADTRWEILRFDDPRPFLVEVRQYLASLLGESS